MQSDARSKYAIYLFILLAAAFASSLLGGPKDLTGPPNPVAVVFLFIFLMVGAHFAARFLSDKTWRRREPYIREVRWSVLDAFMMIVLFVALPIFAGQFLSVFSGRSPPGDQITVEQVSAGVLSHVVVLLFAVAILRQRGDNFAKGMGLTMPAHRRLILVGVVGFVAFWPIRVIHTNVVVALFHNLKLQIQDHPVKEQLLKPGGVDLKLALACSVGLSAPFFEEVFFRGFLYQALRKRVEAWAAIVITAALFAAVHPGLFQATLIFPLGVLLAYLMEKTGSVIPGMVVHFLVNGTSLVLTFLMAG